MKWYDVIIDSIFAALILTFMFALGLLILMGIGYVLLLIPTVYILIALEAIWLGLSATFVYVEYWYRKHIDERGENDNGSESSDYLQG